jgi:2-dehydro-3-deoxygluconokinase
MRRRHESRGKNLSFDPNLRPVLWKSEAEMVEKLNRLAFQADWVLPGLKEGMILTGQQTRKGLPISISRAASRRCH